MKGRWGKVDGERRDEKDRWEGELLLELLPSPLASTGEGSRHACGHYFPLADFGLLL